MYRNGELMSGRQKGMLIVDFGAATTELSVVGSGGMVLNKMLKIGGMTFDVAVQNMVRRNYDFLIGRQTAEALRKTFWSAWRKRKSFHGGCRT